MDTLRVLIADDHPIFRNGMRALLGSVPDLEVVGEATTGDEASAQTVEARPDLNALTDEQWNEIFKFGREQAEPVEYARETPTRSLPLWLAALVVACGIVIGGVKARSYVRRVLRTLTIPLQMKDPSW